MQSSLRFICCFLVVNLAYSAGGETKQEASFVTLFNGCDLSGWVEMGEPGAFAVEKGILVLKNPRYYPNWLRTEREYENFELKLEYRMPGWSEGGLLLHAPLYGRTSRAGIKVHLRHDNQNEGSHSVGGLYGVLPPLAFNSREKEWNRLNVYLNWPVLRVELNGALVQDTNMERHPELRWRLRRGFIGLQDLGREIHFRNIRIQEFPSQERWTELFNGRDLRGWTVQGDAKWEVENGKIIARNGDGYLITDETFSSFEFQTYVWTSKQANGGVFFRWNSDQGRRGYEVQIYNIIDTTNPTGSLYGVVPAEDLESFDGKWFLMQIISDGGYALVRIDGRAVAESNILSLPDRGKIALQMHHKNARIEFLRPRIKQLVASTVHWPDVIK